MIVTDDASAADAVRMLRNHGSRERYHHAVIGYNSRLDDLQAVILRAKLKHIDEYNRRRRINAHRYSDRLKGSGVLPPAEDGKGLHVYHQYTILSEDREAIQQALGAAGIASAVYYPIPLHRQEVYREEWAGISLPVTEDVAGKVLSLPMYPELSEEQIDRTCDVILGTL
jgi:dTDP-4-amino-4,6-dideoxygalactose transaminase